MTPVRVLHCDDSAPFRVLVREMLSEYPDVEMVGEAATPEEAEQALAGAEVDVVLLDLLERRDEDELVDRLRRAAPEVRFVVYTGLPQRAGNAADRHLHKSVPFTELHRVITEVGTRA